MLSLNVVGPTPGGTDFYGGRTNMILQCPLLDIIDRVIISLKICRTRLAKHVKYALNYEKKA